MGGMMKKTVATLLAVILLIPLTLTGCSTQQNSSTSDVQKITYVCDYGYGLSEMYVFTSDYTMKKYRIYSDSSERYGLPKNGNELAVERQITKDNWNTLIDVLNKNDFMELPEELSGNDMPDDLTCYIQVETADGVHKSGGTMAGYGEDEANKRFNAIQRELNNITHPYPMPVE